MAYGRFKERLAYGRRRLEIGIAPRWAVGVAVFGGVFALLAQRAEQDLGVLAGLVICAGGVVLLPER